jgi:hypothetical protein
MTLFAGGRRSGPAPDASATVRDPSAMAISARRARQADAASKLTGVAGSELDQIFD